MYPLSWFAVAVKPADLVAARSQMALSLGWHIIIACFGVALRRSPSSWSGRRTGEETRTSGGSLIGER
jgi:cytochrome d ubiquinol oxidase subunit I